jgi:hypothetical protein
MGNRWPPWKETHDKASRQPAYLWVWADANYSLKARNGSTSIINKMTVQELLAAYKWKLIPNCPGRYVLDRPEPTLAPSQLAQVGSASAEFHVDAAKDVVLILALEGGGLITYCRADGSYHHTLNTESGFQRKLPQLGITLT